MASTIPGNGIDGHGRVAGSKHVSPIKVSLTEVAEIPEQRLMTAVLWDALYCYIRHAQTRDASQRRLHTDAARWIGSGDTAWPYSFENICNVLGLDSAAIRRRLRKRCFGKQGNADAPAPGAAGGPRCAA